ncbi:MAG: hypothetical protein LBL04_02110 [Bacteroidales bacterium]|jgi:hypothetical protein|nr:hypothetical protein [Bacteroidales bacterium]
MQESDRATAKAIYKLLVLYRDYGKYKAMYSLLVLYANNLEYNPHMNVLQRHYRDCEPDRVKALYKLALYAANLDTDTETILYDYAVHLDADVETILNAFREKYYRNCKLDTDAETGLDMAKALCIQAKRSRNIALLSLILSVILSVIALLFSLTNLAQQ